MRRDIEKKIIPHEIDPEPLSSLMIMCGVVGAAASLGSFLIAIMQHLQNADPRELMPKEVKKLHEVLEELIKEAGELKSILAGWENIWKPEIIPREKLEYRIPDSELASGASIFTLAPFDVKVHDMILEEAIRHLKLLYKAQENLGKMDLVFLGDGWQLHPLGYHQEVAKMIANIQSNRNLNPIKKKLSLRMDEYVERAKNLLRSLDKHYPQF